ncbi:MAG: hypothetical protein LWW95_10795 [Candidatus Desulfofervidus auxilii]|nr:hypothetical protein [Candidatus Desulfofervidus auxilii]
MNSIDLIIFLILTIGGLLLVFMLIIILLYFSKIGKSPLRIKGDLIVFPEFFIINFPANIKFPILLYGLFYFNRTYISTEYRRYSAEDALKEILKNEIFGASEAYSSGRLVEAFKKSLRANARLILSYVEGNKLKLPS